MKNLIIRVREINNKFLDSYKPRHPKCLGYQTVDVGNGSEYDCEYGSNLDCEDCKYGLGRKNPEAKCNQFKS